MSRVAFTCLLLCVVSSFSLLAQAPTDTVRLRITTVNFFSDDTSAVRIAVVADSIRDIGALQMSLRWDTAQLSFEALDLSINPLDLDASDYNLRLPGEIGIVKLADGPGQTSFPVASGDTLLQVVFRPLIDQGSAAIDFDGFVQAEFVSTDFNIAPLALTTGGVAFFDRLYPGDTNADRVVAVSDLLNVGLAYGSAGPARPDAATEWAAQRAFRWPDSLPNSRLNFYHIDADGNGRIDSLDVSVIQQNLSNRVTPFRSPPGSERHLSNATMAFETVEVRAGEETLIPLNIGSAEASVDELYGIAFRISFDPQRINPASLIFDYSDSWLAREGAVLIGIQELDAEGGWLDVALSRTNGQSISGFGTLGYLRLEALDFANPDSNRLRLEIVEGRRVSAGEVYDSIEQSVQELPVINATTTTREPVWASAVALYPNPTTDGKLYLETPFNKSATVKLLSSEGRLIRTLRPTNQQIDLKGLPGGTYYLAIHFRGETLLRPIVFQP